MENRIENYIACDADCENGVNNCHHPKDCHRIKKYLNLSVTEFSMLPLQAGLIIKTPKGEGTYEGITSSGLVKVFIDGGIMEFSWSDCEPIIRLGHIQIIENFLRKITKFKALEALFNPPHLEPLTPREQVNK